LLLVAAAALVISSVRLLTDSTMFYADPNHGVGYDHNVYLLMAESGISCNVPPAQPEAPFCWRLVTPLLAKILPFDIQTNFLILAFAGVWLTGTAIYYMTKAFGFSKALAALGMLLFFSMYWATGFVLHDFALSDPLLFLAITLAIHAAARQKALRFALLVAVGVALKESALFVVPLYYTLNAEKFFDARLAGRTMALALPAVAVLVAIRTSLPAEVSYFELLKVFGLPRLAQPSFETLYKWTVGPFGLVPILASLLAIRRNLVAFLRFLPFLLLVYSQPFFASDTSRLLVLAFPAVIVLALNGFASVRDAALAWWTRDGQSSPRAS
jgi:hypothetical protein